MSLLLAKASSSLPLRVTVIALAIDVGSTFTPALNRRAICCGASLSVAAT